MKMKKVLLAMMLLMPGVGYSQTKTIQAQLDSISATVGNILEEMARTSVENMLSNTYKLYPTENIYTLLQLNTTNGKINQVQWNLDKDKEFTMIINDVDLSHGFKFGNYTDRFELYPTKNMYQFILLDKNAGSMWHVQWGTKESERWIRPIH